METIETTTLGVLTDKKFLNGLIPKGWYQKVFDHGDYWSVECKRNDKITGINRSEKENEFNKVISDIKNEFNEYFMEVYSISSCGIHFIVYLKK
jgi:hypothetical protein